MELRIKFLKFLLPAALLPPVLLVLLAVYHVPYTGVFSLIVLLLAILPFFIEFEHTKPRPRDLVPIAVMSAIGALGRALFAAVPSFKPTSAVVIITGMQFGPQAGFLTGALSALASNMFLGQGPWTPWQMYAWGMIGLLSGLWGRKDMLKKRWVLYLWGMAAGVMFGWFLNLQYIVSYIDHVNITTFIASYIASAPMDMTHGISTVIFLALLERPWGKTLGRVKRKYGILDHKK